MTNVVETVEALLKCTVCMDTLKDSRVLPCYHSFCLGCLKSCLARQITPKTVLSCPQCQRECVIPVGGVAVLSKDFRIAEMSDIIWRHRQGRRETSTKEALPDVRPNVKPQVPPEVKVQLAEEIKQTGKSEVKEHVFHPSSLHCGNSGQTLNPGCGNVVAYCTQCQEHGCAACESRDDRLKAMQHRELLYTSDLSHAQLQETIANSLPIPGCCKHPKENAKVYCSSCETPLCTVCSITDHLSHSLEELTEVAEKARRRICATQEMVANILQQLQTCKACLLQTKEKVKNDCDFARDFLSNAAAGIREHGSKLQHDSRLKKFVLSSVEEGEESAQKVRSLVQEQHGALADELNRFQQKVLDCIYDSLEQYDVWVADAESILCLATSPHSDVLAHAAELRAKLEARLSVPFNAVSWQSTLETVKTNALLSATLLGEFKGQCAEESNLCTLVKRFPTRVTTRGCLAVVHGHLYACFGKGKNLWVCTKDGILVTRIEVPELRTALHMGSVPGGHLAITDFQHGKVHFLTVSRSHSTIYHNIVNFTAVDITSSAEYFVMLGWGHALGHGDRLIQIVDHVGTVVNSVSVCGAVQVTAVHTPIGFVIGDITNSELLWTNTVGKAVRRYTYPALPAQDQARLGAPLDDSNTYIKLQKDSRGRVIAARTLFSLEEKLYFSQIHLFSQDGELLGSLVDCRRGGRVSVPLDLVCDEDLIYMIHYTEPCQAEDEEQSTQIETHPAQDYEQEWTSRNLLHSQESIGSTDSDSDSESESESDSESDSYSDSDSSDSENESNENRSMRWVSVYKISALPTVMSRFSVSLQTNKL